MIQTQQLIKQPDEYACLPTDVAKHLASLRQSLAARCEHEKGEKGNEEFHQTARIIRLPSWPEALRGCPNYILRSALFPAIQGKGRQHLENRLIASASGIRIKYTGRQLDQSDLDVLEQVLHLVRKNPLGTVCEFKGGTFLKAIGRSSGKANYKWLGQVLSRQTACEVRFERQGYTYGRGLIASYDIDHNSRLYRVCVDPDMAKLYAAGWSAIDWQQRQALRRKPLALWLQGYYATHAKPLPVKVETLRALSGSNDKTLFSYRQKLRRALDELKAIGAIASWKIDKADLVSVDRGEALTKSQKRHLRRLSVMSRKNKRRLTPQSRDL
jgi:hypothetical protein